MRFRCGDGQAVTQSRMCADAHLRLGGSAAFQRKRAAPVFVTGRKPRESPSAPVAENSPPRIACGESSKLPGRGTKRRGNGDEGQ
jgi:hypothetical protein